MSQLGGQGIATLAVFMIMVYFLYKGVKFGVHMAIAAAAGGAFPFIATFVLKMDVPITIHNVFFYATLAMALYLAALVLHKVKKWVL